MLLNRELSKGINKGTLASVAEILSSHFKVFVLYSLNEAHTLNIILLGKMLGKLNWIFFISNCTEQFLKILISKNTISAWESLKYDL